MNAHHPTTAPSLSARLREVSRGGHSRKSRADGDDRSQTQLEPQYAKAFLRGGLNREGIAAQFAQHYLMYEALERATTAQVSQHGDAFALAMPELRRLAALERDLEFWIGADWEQQVRNRYASPGILEYVSRIEAHASSSLPHFVAHHYTRYLADLSGGLMIAKMFRDSYAITDSEGVRFYEFDEIENPREFKKHYRGLLDEMDFDDEEQRVIVAEVASAYALNNKAGADLDARFADYAA